MTEAMRQAAEFQKMAAAGAAIAIKYRIALVEKKTVLFMSMAQSPESMANVISINENYSAAYYAAARAKMEGL